MTPQKFEYAQELIETAFERGKIGRQVFIERMMKLGFSKGYCGHLADEILETASLKTR